MQLQPKVIEIQPEPEAVKMTVRMPKHLHTWLKQVSGHNSISMNQLISFLLVQVKDGQHLETKNVSSKYSDENSA